MPTLAALNIFDDYRFYLFGIFMLASIFLTYRRHHKPGILLLFLSAFFLRLFMAHLDPFLSDWDERFHALVARNMMTDPFKPMLQTEILIPYDHTLWCCNHIWLHKQPLFLWQMALSMKVFGISEFAIRYPSVLMGALMVPMLYRIGTLYTRNALVAYCAGFLLCCSGYQLELISGYTGMDHNDVAFAFYVLAGIWAYVEYTRCKKIHWVILIGVFAGCAILNKWLTGMLVFSGWGLNILIGIRDKEIRKEVPHLLLALCVCLLVFLPWQVYIFNAFPLEAAYEYSFTARHVFEVVENHGGHNEFYFQRFPLYFGEWIWVLVLAGLLMSFFSKQLSRPINIALITATGVVYIFFSLVVKTKLQSYFFVVAPLCFLFMAIAFGYLLKLSKAGKPLFFAALLIAGYILIDHQGIFARHNPESAYRQHKAYNTRIYKNFRNFLPPGIDIVMNTGNMAHVELMFYNPGINAFHYCYDKENFEILIKQGKRVAVFCEWQKYWVPYYVARYPGTYIIQQELKETDPFYR